jgi:hypothetical protein
MTATAATARVIGLLRATATACQARHRYDRPLSHFGISPLLHESRIAQVSSAATAACSTSLYADHRRQVQPPGHDQVSTGMNGAFVHLKWTKAPFIED